MGLCSFLYLCCCICNIRLYWLLNIWGKYKASSDIKILRGTKSTVPTYGVATVLFLWRIDLMETNKPKMIVIVGPTASGKSDIAVQLALRLSSGQAKEFGIKGAGVISADSRQVYKGLNIGTGKITKKEMQGVKHHLLDVANPSKQFTVSDFVNVTNETIVQIVTKNKLPIVCGGTGFYIDALLGDKQVPEEPPNLKLRKGLEKKPVDKLFEILQKLDPERSKNIDAKNPRRLVRAIEICKALGKVPN